MASGMGDLCPVTLRQNLGALRLPKAYFGHLVEFTALELTMSFSLNFDQKLRQTLHDLVPQYGWVTGWGADERSRVDVAGLRDGLRVLVEVELKKDNPVENVVKIWRWAADQKGKKDGSRILFLQAFSAHYVNDPGSRAHPKKVKQHERAIFIGERMASDRGLHISYTPLTIYTTTRDGQLKQFKPLMRRGVIVKAGGGAMHRAAENLGTRIADLLT
jgi:hypothetical protein